MLQMRCSHRYTLNKNVFSLRLNMSSQRLMFGVQQEDCSIMIDFKIIKQPPPLEPEAEKETFRKRSGKLTKSLFQLLRTDKKSRLPC